MAIRFIDDGNPDGTVLGQASTSLLGFYGLATAIARPSVTAYTTTTVAVSTSHWGYASSTQADAVNTAARQAVTTLRALGLAG